MGNSTSNKPVNSLNVSLSVRNFGIHGIPQKPAQWAQRIDERTWNEFINICHASVALPDAQQRKTEYQMWQCRFWGGMALLLVGIGFGTGFGVGGGVNNNTVMWVFGIILGVGGFCGGIALFMISVTRYGEINKQFIADVKANLSARLADLNNKYNGIMRFSVRGTGKNIFKKEDEADTTINISIQIEILVQSVQYIPDQHQQGMMMQQQVIQQQTIQVPAGAQGQIVMIQLADGRMVPAQIQGQQQVQYLPQGQYQAQGQPQVQYVPASGYNQPQAAQPYALGGGHVEPQTIVAPSVPDQPPAYNPNANVEGGEGGEGGKPTHGYQ